MRSLLEKSIVHLLNGEQDKAAALFHKFMVERARKVHESLRQDEDVDLNPGWDSEITEEEYFNNDDLASDETDPGDDMGDDMGDAGGDLAADDAGDDVVDDMGDAGVDDAADEVPDLDDEEMNVGEPEEGGDVNDELVDKMDNIEDKMDQLTAEFERLMSEFEDDDMNLGEPEDDEFTDAGDEGLDDEGLGDEGLDDLDDVEGEEPDMEAGDEADLADRMEDDMGDDETGPEEKAMESSDMGDMDDDELDEQLADITESVLSELDKINVPKMESEGKEVGTGGSIKTNTKSNLPNHGVEDRVKGAKPTMIKGGNNDSMARETPPSTKGVDALVKGAKNSRKSWSDGMDRKSKEGDASAKINSDYASRPATKSTLDGKSSK